ncbi:MAG: arginine deiminase-related protein [bacterium]|nr:arginine deiminase-related protein [bacterium]
MTINSATVKKQVFMIEPTHFEVIYNINPAMAETLEKGQKIKKKPARREWEGLRNIYTDNGLERVGMDSIKGLPDIVFTANGGFAHNGRIVMGRFKYPERQPESEHFYKWFTENEYETVRIDEDFEGGGDMLLWQGKFIGGHGFRSTFDGIKTAASFATFWGKEDDLVPLKLIDPRFYHLDTCFCPIGEHAFYFPGAIAPDSCEALLKLGKAVPVSEADALKMVCNGVYFEGSSGPKFVVNDISRKLEKMLEKWGIETIINKTSEFQKSGGSNRCLSLFL